MPIAYNEINCFFSPIFLFIFLDYIVYSCSMIKLLNIYHHMVTVLTILETQRILQSEVQNL